MHKPTQLLKAALEALAVSALLIVACVAIGAASCIR